MCVYVKPLMCENAVAVLDLKHEDSLLTSTLMLSGFLL